jgi:membrane protein implicated in regulation of membrane protease activity
LVVAVAVLAGVAVYYASVPLTGFVLLDLTGVSLAMDRLDGLLLFVAAILLSVIFAVLTALWITRIARTQASRNREDQGEGSPPPQQGGRAARKPKRRKRWRFVFRVADQLWTRGRHVTAPSSHHRP